MRTHWLRGLCLSVSLLALTACTAASPAAQSQPVKPPPQMSDPLPPVRMSKPATGMLDKSCKSSADCTIKDVGNCCGAMPACVNKDSPTDPAAVRAECARSGRMDVCGFREISACQCTDGRCEEAGGQVLPVRPGR